MSAPDEGASSSTCKSIQNSTMRSNIPRPSSYRSKRSLASEDSTTSFDRHNSPSNSVLPTTLEEKLSAQSNNDSKSSTRKPAIQSTDSRVPIPNGNATSNSKLSNQDSLLNFDPALPYTKPTRAYLAGIAPPRPQESATDMPKWQMAIKVEHKITPSILNEPPPSTKPQALTGSPAAASRSPWHPTLKFDNSSLLKQPTARRSLNNTSISAGATSVVTAPGSPCSTAGNTVDSRSLSSDGKPKTSSAIRAALKAAKQKADRKRHVVASEVVDTTAIADAKAEQQENNSISSLGSFAPSIGAGAQGSYCAHCSIYRLKLKELQGEKEELLDEIDALNDELESLDCLLSESGDNLRKMHENYIKEKLESERLRALLAEIGGENISIRRQSFAGSSESSRSSTPATVPLRRTESDRTHNSSDLLGLATGSALRSLPSFPDVDIDVEGVNSVPAEPIKGIALMDDMELAGNTAGFVSLHSESTDRTSNLVIDQDHSMIGILSGEDNTTITNEAVMSPAKQGNPLASYASSSKLDDNVIDIEQVQETLRGRTSSGSSEVDDLDILAMRQAQLQRHLHLRNSFSGSVPEIDEILREGIDEEGPLPRVPEEAPH